MCMKNFKPKSGYLLLEAIVGLGLLVSFTLVFLSGVQQQLTVIHEAHQAVKNSRELFACVTKARAGITSAGCTIDFSQGEIHYQVGEVNETHIFIQPQ